MFAIVLFTIVFVLGCESAPSSPVQRILRTSFADTFGRFYHDLRSINFYKSERQYFQQLSGLLVTSGVLDTKHELEVMADISEYYHERQLHEQQHDRHWLARWLNKNLTAKIEQMAGKCLEMCPSHEHRERQATKEYSILECHPSSPHLFQPALAIKIYRRSAAGKDESRPENIRPPHTLVQTIAHLLDQTLARADPKTGDVEFHVAYLFIDDRLRAVRKDFTIQNSFNRDYMTALQQIIRFYVFSGCFIYAVPEQSRQFSLALHDQQLNSALVSMRTTYETLADDSPVEMSEILAYEMLLRLFDSEIVSSYLAALPHELQTHPRVHLATKLCIAAQTDEFQEFFQLWERTTRLEKCVLHRHWPVIWTRILAIMTKTYMKQDRFPLVDLERSLHLPNASFVASILSEFNIAATIPEAPTHERGTGLESWAEVENALLPAPSLTRDTSKAFARFRELEFRPDLTEHQLEPLFAVAYSIIEMKVAKLQDIRSWLDVTSE